MIYGIGIDLVQIARIKAIMDKWGDKFLRRIFSVQEIRHCTRLARPEVHFAALFAVKEAFLKAIGLGMGAGVRCRDIETIHDEKGKPLVRTTGGAKRFLAANDICSVQVSISHTELQATAIVVIERK